MASDHGRDPWPAPDAIGPATEFLPSSTLFRQGEPVTGLYHIDTGFVKLTRAEDSGRSVIVAIRSRGWLLGAAAALLDRVHPLTAETVSSCVVRRLSSAEYSRILREDSDVARWVHEMQAREAYDQVVLLGQFAVVSPRQRLERFLARVVAGTAPRQDGARRIQLPLKQHELAQAIAVTPEHLSRLFAQLETDGLLRRNKGWLVVSGGSPLAGRTIEPFDVQRNATEALPASPAHETRIHVGSS